MFNFLKKLVTPTEKPVVAQDPNQEEPALSTSPKAEENALVKKQLQYFAFLEKEYGFKIAEKAYRKGIYHCQYEKGNRKVFIRMEFDTGKILYLLFNGAHISYKLHLDTDYIRDFYWLFVKSQPELSWHDLYPKDTALWERSLESNAALLKQYGEEVLLGEEWF